MQHELIIFYGASPGVGKSTLSTFLVDQLLQQDIPTHWLYEDDVLGMAEFAPVVRGFQGEQPFDPFSALLVAMEKLVTIWSQQNGIVVTDSLLPFIDWLFPSAPSYQQLAAFTRQLEHTLRPLRPLLIYLDGDIELALRRAVVARGQPWLDNLIPWMNTWKHNRDTPIQGFDGVVVYMQQRRHTFRQLLADWTGDLLVLNTTEHSEARAQSLLLAHLGLTRHESASRLRKEAPKHVVGSYRLQDEIDEGNPDHAERELDIYLVDDELFVSAYWPNGCPLDVLAPTIFRLRNTSHWIEVHPPAASAPQSLHYHARGKSYRYQQVNQSN